MLLFETAVADLPGRKTERRDSGGDMERNYLGVWNKANSIHYV